MLIRGTQSCFKFRIIFTEQRCKYLFVTNIFGNFFIVCRKTISHGFSFYCVRVRFIFHISVGGFFILRKFIVTLFRDVFNMFAGVPTQRRQRRHSVRRLRMCNVVMIISNEMERTCLIHRASASILPLCRCVDFRKQAVSNELQSTTQANNSRCITFSGEFKTEW